MNRSKGAVAVALSIIATMVSGDDVVPVSRREIEGLTSGKTWTQRIDATGTTIVWTFNRFGYVTTTHTSMDRGTALDNRVHLEKGTWTVDDDGQFCIKWRGGYPDQCVFVLREGEHLRLANPQTPTKPFAELTVE